MKIVKLFILLLFIAFKCVAQNNKTNTSDTINNTDLKGKKQGHWIILGKDKQKTCFKSYEKIEEGYYINNKKNGIWTEYYCNGFVKSVLTFFEGRPDGLQKTFYDNGQIKDVGFWRKNKWEGVHKKYSKEGKQIIDSVKVSKHKKAT